METTHETCEVSIRSVGAVRWRGRLSLVSAWGEVLEPETGAVPQNGIL